MDDEKNKMLFSILSEDCEWKDDISIGGYDIQICSACSKPCEQKVCMPLRFSLFFNRPEVRNGRI